MHQLAEGRELWLGGIRLQHSKGALGHSDADVLLHAICDGILGAANLRDIGHHFPDNNADFKGIDSKILLKKTIDLAASHGWRVVNVDTTLLLENPKIAPHIDAMKVAIATASGVGAECISIKATTNESMGYVGRGEGIVAHAVVLLQKD